MACKMIPHKYIMLKIWCCMKKINVILKKYCKIWTI